MKLSLPFIQLPLLFDADAMAREIDALGESVWMPHPQGFPGNSMLPLLAIDGDPANESYAGAMRPTPHLQRCPYLMQAMASLGATLGRSRLMRLSGHAEVTRHADQGYYWLDRVRVHIPVRTQPSVRFECGDAQVNMAAGECWIFDTWRQHRVLNDDTRERIHLVVDTVGGERFWNCTSAGRSHDGRALSGRWAPQRIAPQGELRPALTLETANVPRVMTPWELSARIGFLLQEAVPHPNLARLQPLAGLLMRRWQGLWATWGEREEGWPEYRRALEAFMQEAVPLTQTLVLQNELPLSTALGAQVGKVAVMSTPTNTPRQASATPIVPASRAGDSRDAEFDRPVFVVSSPRSGSTMLFEVLAGAPGVFTIGGESHVLIEGMPALHPANNGLLSNRLTAAEATPAVISELRARFRAALVDRDGRPAGAGRIRMLEKTPKNSLRIPFLAKVFPEARFVYLYRDPRETLGSMMDAWNSGRFRTYPNLPGWQGPAWSMLLIPGWQALIGRALGEVVATQWETATRTMLDDLTALGPDRVHTVRYDALVRNHAHEIRRLCDAVGFEWDARMAAPPPMSRYTLSPPAADKWRRHAEAIEPQLDRLRATMERADRFAGIAGVAAANRAPPIPA